MVYKNYKIAEFDDKDLPRIKAGESISIGFCQKTLLREISGEEGEKNVSGYHWKLRLTGDVDVQQNWMWEGGFPRLYRLIDDALSTQTRQSQFCLKLEMNREEWPRRAYFQLPCPPRLTPQFPAHPWSGNWAFSIWVKAENLFLEEEGKARIVIETYKKKAGVNEKEIKNGPDEVMVLNFPEGTYAFTRFDASVPISEDTASLLFYVECEKAGGTIWLEDPRLMNGYGENVLPQFTVTNPFHECFNWFGENLSRKEWTDMEVCLNGKQIFEGELFQRTHRYSEQELELSANDIRPGENILEIRNKNHYFAPLPYKLKKVELLYAREWPVTLIACPSVVYAGRPFGILVRTKHSGDMSRTFLKRF